MKGGSELNGTVQHVELCPSCCDVHGLFWSPFSWLNKAACSSLHQLCVLRSLDLARFKVFWATCITLPVYATLLLVKVA